MQILQLLGILVILNTLTCAGWFVLQGRQLSPGIVSVIAVAVLSGLVMTIRGRSVEASSQETAKIKLAEQQVVADGRQIAALKEQIQTQAVTLESLTHESAETRRLLDGLNQAHQRAEEELKRVTASDSVPPAAVPGYVLTNSPRGESSENLQESRTRMMQAYEQKDYLATYEAAKTCIRLFEAAQYGKSGSPDQVGAGLTPDDIAVLYGIGAEMALRLADNNQAVEWAQKGVSASPSAEGKFTLVAALYGASRNEQARKIVDETLSQTGLEVDKFRALLHESGLLKAQN